MKVERSLETKGDQQEEWRAGEGDGRGTISVSLRVAMMKFPDKRHLWNWALN